MSITTLPFRYAIYFDPFDKSGYIYNVVDLAARTDTLKE